MSARPLTDEQLDALAERLYRACIAARADRVYYWAAMAREAARWAEEQQGEVVWEVADGMGYWYATSATHAKHAEAVGRPVRAIRVIATTTKEGE